MMLSMKAFLTCMVMSYLSAKLANSIGRLSKPSGKFSLPTSESVTSGASSELVLSNTSFCSEPSTCVLVLLGPGNAGGFAPLDTVLALFLDDGPTGAGASKRVKDLVELRGEGREPPPRAVDFMDASVCSLLTHKML